MKVEQDSFWLSFRLRRLIDEDISGFSLRSSLFDENSKFNLSSELFTLGDLATTILESWLQERHFDI